MNAVKRLTVAMTIPFATINPPDTPVSVRMATSCKRMEGHASVSILCHVGSGTTEGGGVGDEWMEGRNRSSSNVL